MNKQRREAIKEIIEELDEIKQDMSELAERLESVTEKIEDVRSEEEDAFDSMPESLQDSDRGERMQSAIDCLDSAASEVDSWKQGLEDYDSTCDEAIAYLGDAVNA